MWSPKETKLVTTDHKCNIQPKEFLGLEASRTKQGECSGEGPRVKVSSHTHCLLWLLTTPNIHPTGADRCGPPAMPGIPFQVADAATIPPQH